MNKKIILIIIIVLIIGLGIGGYFMLNSKDNNDNKEQIDNDNDVNTNKKVLVVYYSASGSTERVAKEIADNMNADLFEIVPKDVYSNDDLDWTDKTSRVNKEHDDESLRNIELVSTDVNNWNDYDIVLIGYPIWWGIAAWPVDNFVKDNDFTGKTVIPFCTSASSSLGSSGELLKDMSNGGNWLEGHRFSSSASSSDISKWTDSLK